MSEIVVETAGIAAPFDEPVLVESVSQMVTPEPASASADTTIAELKPPAETARNSPPNFTARQSREEAVLEARQFVYDQSFGTLNTINKAGNFEGFPAGQIEYFVDNAEDDASLLLIAVDMSSAFRNISKGSPASLSIRTGDQPEGQTPLRAAAAKRIILYGEFDFVEPSPFAKAAFFKIHPDALEWAPGLPGFHKTQWIKFTITGIYYIGGFGDRHYIGQLPVAKYVDAPVSERRDNKEEEGVFARFSKLIWRGQ